MLSINKNTNESQLIARLHNNDKSALTTLYNMYWQPLYISAYNLLKDKEACEDVIQDVFINIWKNREKIQVNVSIKSYLYACVRYQVYDKFRKNKKLLRTELLEGFETRLQYNTPETEIIYQELVQQIKSIVENLPTKCRKVYRLSREEELSHKEISKRLNISTKTVESHITKALNMLRTAMGSVLLSLALILYTVLV